jgi:NitT/TauT family transport system substrate-binding protein
VVLLDRRQALAGIAALTATIAARPVRAQALETVNMGKLIGLTDAAFYIAHAKGYFKEQSLNVVWTTFPQSQAMVAPLAQGSLDGMGASVSAGIYNAIGAGIPIKIVGDRGIDYAPYGALPLIVRSDLIKSGRFKTLDDLKGLRFAEPGRGSANLPIVYRFVKKAGLNYNDIEHVFLPFPDQVAGMRNGNIDASTMIEPFAASVVKDGTGVRFMADYEAYPNHQISALMFSNNFVQKRTEVAKRFFVGYLRGLRYYHDALKGGRLAGPTSDDVIAILQSEIKLPDPSVWKTVVPASVQTNGRVDVPSLAFDYEVFKELGLIDKPVNVVNSIDMQFADYAAKQIGPYRPHH